LSHLKAEERQQAYLEEAYLEEASPEYFVEEV
jgi:hypothetical protein